jgi:hypothetical protein
MPLSVAFAVGLLAVERNTQEAAGGDAPGRLFLLKEEENLT